jgi:hypothetical protein
MNMGWLHSVFSEQAAAESKEVASYFNGHMEEVTCITFLWQNFKLDYILM